VSRGGAGGYGLPVGGVGTARLADGAVTTDKLAAGAVTPTKLDPLDATVVDEGVHFTVMVPFTAAAAGTPDDVTVYAGNCPSKRRYIDSLVKCTTAIGSSTGQLRSATGGGGSAISSAMSTGTTATSGRDVGGGITLAAQTIAANGDLYFRRSDRGIAGVLYITFLKLD
jgi:hypothetical protein